ncbi:beta-1,3-galactosyltransferase 2-like isoform X2 [Phyllopteryx taeniolatus]|uniref:beta-1,3-galactosyltransferase 2-like isoform X2 n=1 Tax=Phyllopteryx taeniolatus TaxID=161469 RepID=UPI002AD43C87|nr:beta-1,3-galactosyltransferase 2-like isoform X2 [Phyllopteryx taeniolatus]
MEDQKRSPRAVERLLRRLYHCHQKKTCFTYLFLLCVTFVFFSIWSEKYLLHQHYQRLASETSRVNAPPYRVHPKHRVKLDSTNPKTSIVPLSGGTQYHLAYPQNYHFIMDVGDVCDSHAPFLVLMVPVEPANVAARDAIRSTWGKKKLVQGKKVLTLFMQGSVEGADLRQENELHGDLIQSDFKDTYLNLTIKTMVIMEWLATRCPTAAYAMKIDSDMFLNIDKLVLMLQKPGIPQTDYLTGMLMRKQQVCRSESSKWYVPEEMYPDRKYPLYTLGMGYVFSNDLPRKLVAISKSIKPFNIEDAYIGMCMKKLGLAPTSPPDPSQFRTYNTKFSRCTYSKIITSILSSPNELISFWMALKMPGPPC